MFSGRIGRKNFLLLIGPAYLVPVTMSLIFPEFFEDDYSGSVIVEALIIASIVVLMFFVIALHNKRFHDLGLSGWFQLLIFGPIGSLILGLLPGQKRSNKYGDPPAESVFVYRVSSG